VDEPTTKPLILVVDDHESQRSLFKLLSDRLEVSVHVVADGVEALEAVKTFNFDAVLMDVQMPGMNGYQCTRKIREMEREINRHTPIIAVTACVLPGDREKCFDSGMDDYLSKPFELSALRAKIDTWIVRKA